MDELINSLSSKFSWEVVIHTYGNSHSTLIGLVSEWWCKRDKNNSVLDGAPTYYSTKNKEHPRGKGASKSDLILIENKTPVGVVEVEGTHYLNSLEKIGKYFSSTDFSTIKFGIFITYGYKTVKSGNERKFVSVPIEELLKKSENIIQKYSHKKLYIINLKKEYVIKGKIGEIDDLETKLRKKQEWYRGNVNKVKIYKIPKENEEPKILEF